jgi:hypothetical protein
MSRLTFTEVLDIRFGDAEIEAEVRCSGTYYRGHRPVYWGSHMEPGEPPSFEPSSVEWRLHDKMAWEPMPAVLVEAIGDALDAAGCEAWQHECEAAEERRAEAQRERDLFGDAAE